MPSSLFGSQQRIPQGMTANKGAGGLNPQILQQIKQSMNKLRGAANPQQALMQAAQQSPQLNAVMQMCQGKNPQEVFAEQCRQHGMNPDEAMRQIQQMLS